MNDRECIGFLQWCLPQLGYRWPGFRKVRSQVCKRVARRIDALQLDGMTAYRRYLLDNDAEWSVLDSLCRVTISRFFRDRGVFDTLRTTVLPDLARQAAAHEGDIRCWSAGCASGEEPYSLRVLWDLCVGPVAGTGVALRIVATDCDEHLLERARRALYPGSSVREVPSQLLETAFEARGDRYLLKEAFRTGVTLVRQEIRDEAPPGMFHLVMCRNLAFTYFDDTIQQAILRRIVSRLLPGGRLVIGGHETLPLADGANLLRREAPAIFAKRQS